MNVLFTDLLAIIGVIMDALPQALLALAFGFASIPTAIAFFVGAAGNAITGNVAPISFQAETITYAGTSRKNRAERCTVVFIGALILTIIGVCGVLTNIIDFIGPNIANGMMAGVGLLLTKASLDMVREDHIAGGVSVVTALITYFLTRNSTHTLIYTIVVCVVSSSIVSTLIDKEEKVITVEEDKFTHPKFVINRKVLMGAFGMACLNIGSNISFGQITADMANVKDFNVDYLTVISSLADMGSSFFGGAPVESIISTTATAPHPVGAGIVLMIIVGIILLSGLVPKIGHFVPTSSGAGFLLVLGLFSTFIADAPLALTDAPAVGGTTLVVTAFSNPFFGMLAGIVVRFIGM